MAEGKIARLIALFEERDRAPIDYVLRLTEISKVGTLKVHMHNLRKAGVVNLTVNKGFIERVNSELTAPQAVKEPVNFESARLTPFIVRIVMGAIGMGAVGMSTYYTSIWFGKLLWLPIAILCAATIVLYISFALEASHSMKGFLKWMLRVTALMMMVFSMVSTIAGQYKSDTDKKEAVNEQANAQALSLLQVEERSLEETLASTKQELDDNTVLLGQFGKDDLESKAYKDLFWKSYSLRKIRDDTANKLEKKRSEIRAFTQQTGTTQVVQNTFYTWIASWLPLSPTMLEFWLYLFPALFYDIMAPLGLHIALKREARSDDN